MAGDWIKMRTSLWDDGRVRVISRVTQVSRSTVTGALYRLWSLADEHTTDGLLFGFDCATLDSEVGVPGFAAALLSPEVDWLEDVPKGLQVKRFGEHNGESAKTRAQGQKRQSRFRNARVTQTALPEKRREEKRRREKKETPQPPKGGLELEWDDIPVGLQSPKFRAAWGEWKADRAARRKTLSERAKVQQLRKLAEMGVTRAIAAIEFSIASGYTGIFEPSPGRAGANGTAHRDTKRAEEFPEPPLALPIRRFPGTGSAGQVPSATG